MTKPTKPIMMIGMVSSITATVTIQPSLLAMVTIQPFLNPKKIHIDKIGDSRPNKKFPSLRIVHPKQNGLFAAVCVRSPRLNGPCLISSRSSKRTASTQKTVRTIPALTTTEIPRSRQRRLPVAFRSSSLNYTTELNGLRDIGAKNKGCHL